MPQAGEPLFLQDDTAGAIALAEEERDTCPSCGLPKAWCRDPANQFGVFEPREEQCHVTYALTAYRNGVNESRDDVTRSAVQMWAGFAKGKEPDLTAGLDLPGEGDDGEQGADQREHKH